MLAGGNAVCVRLSNRELDPLWGASLRFISAAALLWGIVAVTGRSIPRGRALGGAIVYGLLNFGAAFALAYYGMIHSPAGSAGVFLALVPLLTLASAAIHRQERPTRAGLVGGLLAVAGIWVIGADSLSTAIPFTSTLALVGSAACFAEATVVARQFPQADPFTTNAIGMTVAAVALFAGAIVTQEAIVLPQQAATWLALAYLVPIGSVMVFALFLVVVRHWPASRAAYVDVLIPIATAIVATSLLDETIRPELVAGGALVLLGTVIGAIAPKRHAASVDGSATRPIPTLAEVTLSADPPRTARLARRTPTATKARDRTEPQRTPAVPERAAASTANTAIEAP